MLYPPITSILQRFVPIFEQVLSDALRPDPPLLIDIDPMAWYEYLGEGPENEGDDNADSYNARYEACMPFVSEPHPSCRPAQMVGLT